MTFEAYQKAVQQICPNIETSAWDYLKSGLSVKMLAVKDFFIRSDVVHQEIGFVVKGLLRAFYIDAKGNEITIRFATEGTYATHYTAFITQTKSAYYYQCLEPSQLIVLPYIHIQKCYEKHPGLERYGRLIAEEVLKGQQSRIESFQFYNAEQRYLNFIRAHPDLFNRVSLSHLSSFLGIERPSLSRIRKKLATQ